MKLPKPSEYIAIEAWGHMLQSYDYYIRQEQERAAQDNAPIDAIYHVHLTNEWKCMSDLMPDHSFRSYFKAYQERAR